MSMKTDSNASLIRGALARAKDGLTIDELAAVLAEHMTKAQVKAACFWMCRVSAYAHGAPLVKCGTGGWQRFKLAAAKPKPAPFKAPITPSASVLAKKPELRVETIEEWMRRTGKVVERLPAGASAHPLRRIFA